MATAKRNQDVETIELSLTETETRGLCNLITAHTSADFQKRAGIRQVHIALQQLGFEADRIPDVLSEDGVLDILPF